MTLLTFLLDQWILVLAAVTSGALLAWPLLSRGTQGGKVSAAEAVRLINREKALLIDISEPSEYAAAHAAGARSFPLGGLQNAPNLPKNKSLPLVVLCASGVRATRGVAILKKLGYENAHALAGGLAAWREANLPLEKSA